MIINLFSFKRFKPIELNTMFEPCIGNPKCFQRDKKRYQGLKRYQSEISFLCPPVINLIKAQVCDNYLCIQLHDNYVQTCQVNKT